MFSATNSDRVQNSINELNKWMLRHTQNTYDPTIVAVTRTTNIRICKWWKRWKRWVSISRSSICLFFTFKIDCEWLRKATIEGKQQLHTIRGTNEKIPFGKSHRFFFLFRFLFFGCRASFWLWKRNDEKKEKFVNINNQKKKNKLIHWTTTWTTQ